MSQRDNAVNAEISRASVATSNAAARDSTDMRTIGAVTLAFLPGTFTAVSGQIHFFEDFFDADKTSDSLQYWILQLPKGRSSCFWVDLAILGGYCRTHGFGFRRLGIVESE
jgi:hypothetical protein